MTCPQPRRHARIPDSVHCHIGIVAARHELTIGMVMSTSHEKRVVDARREICFYLRDQGHSLSVIGRWLGRHHTSIRALMIGHARPDPAPEYDASQADESGVWAI